MRYSVVITVCLVLATSMSTRAGEAAPTAAELQGRIEQAVRRGSQYLLDRIGDDGVFADEFPAGDVNHGAKTSLAACALLTAGVGQDSRVVKEAIKFISGAEPASVYAVAMRAGALAMVRGKSAMELLTRDVNWLVDAAGTSGAYGGAASAGEPDNWNSHLAVMGVWAGAGRGVRVPQEYWQRVKAYWNAQQQVDGGWGYAAKTSARLAKPSGAMTAAGVAVLFVCLDNIPKQRFTGSAPENSMDYKPISDGLAWLGKRFSVTENPNSTHWYYYWLYCLERAGLASGRKYFAGHDWYLQGARELLDRQNQNGSWGTNPRSMTETCYALLFLARGSHPVLINKLQYAGRWNTRPRDMANLTRWLSINFERQVTWQVVGLDSPLTDWRDAPIMYISGGGPIDMSRQQIKKLRTFVLQGGMIVSEAATNSAAFNFDIQRIYRRMFPRYALQPLGKDHPLLSVGVDGPASAGLFAISNGIRMFVIHSPRQLSKALQQGVGAEAQSQFKLWANMQAYATANTVLPPRGGRAWPVAGEYIPVATARLARITFNGNYDPEPMAWRRFAAMLAKSRRIKLELSEPMAPSKLDASVWPAAVMSGTGSFELHEQTKAALTKYLQAGGTLIVDATGSEKFDASFREHVLPLVPQGREVQLAAGHEIYSSPVAIDAVTYRRRFARALGPDRNLPRLRAIVADGRVQIIYSAEDLATGLLGCPVYGLRGYSPDSAFDLMTNIIHYAAIDKTPDDR